MILSGNPDAPDWSAGGFLHCEGTEVGLPLAYPTSVRSGA